MSGIIVTEAHLTMLRKGAVQTVRIPALAPADTARMPKPPWTVGKAYGVQLKPFTKAKLRVVLTSLELEDPDWCLTIKPGNVETPVFLAARPGSQRSDYTTVPARAMRDEPEVLSESYEMVIARLGGQDQLARRQRRDALQRLHASIRELEVSHPEQRGQIQRLKAQARRLDAA